MSRTLYTLLVVAVVLTLGRAQDVNEAELPVSARFVTSTNSNVAVAQSQEPVEEPVADLLNLMEKMTEGLFDAIPELVESVTEQSQTEAASVQKSVMPTAEQLRQIDEPQAEAVSVELPREVEAVFSQGIPFDLPIKVQFESDPQELMAEDVLRDMMGRRFGPFGGDSFQPFFEPQQAGPLDVFFSSDFFPASFQTFPINLFRQSPMDIFASPREFFEVSTFENAYGEPVDSMDFMDCDGMMPAEDLEVEVQVEFPGSMEVSLPEAQFFFEGEEPTEVMIIELESEEVPETSEMMAGSDLMTMLLSSIEAVEVVPEPELEAGPFLIYSEALPVNDLELIPVEMVITGVDSSVEEWLPLDQAELVSVLSELTDEAAMQQMPVEAKKAAPKAIQKPAVKAAGWGGVLQKQFDRMEDGISREESQAQAGDVTPYVCMFGVLAVLISVMMTCCCYGAPETDTEDSPHELTFLVDESDVNAYTPLMTTEVPEEKAPAMEPLEFENPIKAGSI